MRFSPNTKTSQQQRICLGLAVGAGFSAFCASAQAARQLTAVGPETRVTAENYDLHMGMMYAILIVFSVVLGVMLHSIYVHRKSAGAGVVQFHRKIAVEIVWAVIPFVILFGVAWPATRTLAGLNSSVDADITIKATGMQWKWGYEYLKGDGEGISFFSNLYAPRVLAVGSKDAGRSNLLQVDNPVVVPVNKKIRLVLTADDVIHSWHVPDLGVKEDAIPGLARDTWFIAQDVGTYRGLCSIEACGAGRACVLIVVKVVNDDDYKAWTEGRIRAAGALAQGGANPSATN